MEKKRINPHFTNILTIKGQHCKEHNKFNNKLTRFSWQPYSMEKHGGEKNGLMPLKILTSLIDCPEENLTQTLAKSMTSLLREI